MAQQQRANPRCLQQEYTAKIASQMQYQPSIAASYTAGLVSTGVFPSSIQAVQSVLKHMTQEQGNEQNHTLLASSLCHLALRGLIEPAKIPEMVQSIGLHSASMIYALIKARKTSAFDRSGSVNELNCLVDLLLSVDNCTSVLDAAALVPAGTGAIQELADACRLSDHAASSHCAHALHTLVQTCATSAHALPAECKALADALGPLQCFEQLRHLLSAMHLHTIASPTMLIQLAKVASNHCTDREAVIDELDSALKRASRKREHIAIVCATVALLALEANTPSASRARRCVATLLKDESDEIDTAACTTIRSALSSGALDRVPAEELRALAHITRDAHLSDLTGKLDGKLNEKLNNHKNEEHATRDCANDTAGNELHFNESKSGTKAQEEVKSLVQSFEASGCIPDSVRRLIRGPAKARWTSEIQPALLQPSDTNDAQARAQLVAALRSEDLIRSGATAELRRNIQSCRRAESRHGPPLARVRAIVSLVHSFVFDGDEAVEFAQKDVKRIGSAVRDLRSNSDWSMLHELACESIDGMRSVLSLDKAGVLAAELVNAFDEGAAHDGLESLSGCVFERLHAQPSSTVQAAASVAAELLRLRRRPFKRKERPWEENTGKGGQMCNAACFVHADERLMFRVLPFARIEPITEIRLQESLPALVKAACAYTRACIVRGCMYIASSASTTAASTWTDDGEQKHAEDVLHGYPFMPIGVIRFMQWSSARLKWATSVLHGEEESKNAILSLLDTTLESAAGKEIVQIVGELDTATANAYDAALLVRHCQ